VAPSPPIPPSPVASVAFYAATVASGPQPASTVPTQPPVMLPSQGMGAAQPFGYQPPPVITPGVPPTRMAALAAANSVLQAGTVRTADQMEGEAPGDVPPAKLPGGALYPEEDWIAMHPVRTSHIRLYNTLTRTFSPLTVSHLSSNPNAQRSLKARMEVTRPDRHDSRPAHEPTLRHRILQHTGSSVPASKIRLSYMGKIRQRLRC